MKKLILAIAVLAGIACAGPALNSWVPAGGSNPVWLIISRNAVVTLATSGSLIYHGTALASSVTIPATQSLINVECDGSKCYIN